MRKIAICSLILCLFLLGSSAFAADRPSLAVRVFDNKTDGNPPAAAITDMMTTELFNAGIFSLVERERLEYVADEIRLGQSGLMDMSTAPEVGRIRGAQYSMTGAITLYYYNASAGTIFLPGVAAGLVSNTGYVTLDLRIIDNATSEVVYAAAEQGASNQTIGGIATGFAAFGQGRIGGVLAGATRNAVMRHVDRMKAVF